MYQQAWCSPLFIHKAMKSKQSSTNPPTTDDDVSMQTPKTRGLSKTPTQNVFEQQSKRIGRLLIELNETMLKEQQIRSFYAEEVAILNRIYASEMIQNIQRLDKSYKEGNCSTKRKNTIGEIMLDACEQLTEINREAYAETVKPYLFKYSNVQKRTWRL